DAVAAHPDGQWLAGAKLRDRFRQLVRRELRNRALPGIVTMDISHFDLLVVKPTAILEENVLGRVARLMRDASLRPGRGKLVRCLNDGDLRPVEHGQLFS